MRLELADQTRLGRAEDMDLVLPDAAVSRAHALLRRRNLSWLLEDLGSRHGTFINGEPVQGTRALLPNDEIRIGQSAFLFDSDFDIQNADYTDRSVYFASPQDDTVEVPPVAVLTRADERGEATGEGLEFIVRLGELFDSSRTSFSDALRHTGERIASLFHAENTLIMLWDSAAGQLRTSVAISPHGEMLADASVIKRVFQDRKALLISDRPEIEPHPAPEAPAPPPSRSLLCAPLEVDESGLGVLYLERRELDVYSLVDLRNARAVAKLLAIFVEARQKAEALDLRTRFALRDSKVLGNSPKFREAMDLVARVAPTRANVLLMGETGTGKEVVARAIHDATTAKAAGGPFVPLNCSAIPETLFESALFGHEMGAFTGAIRLQKGAVEQASGGTLFLDEIGELSLAMQPKLLRFIQEKIFTRVGGTRPIRAEVRLICATNRDLIEEVRAARFREDLYHRISVLPIILPPLRERRGDILPLASHFVELHNPGMGRAISGISPEAVELLERYPWPGNIRELSNSIERAVLLCDGKVLLPRHFAHLVDSQWPAAPGDPSRRGAPEPFRPRPLSEVEADHIARVLESCGNNQVRAAEVLGIHRNTLRKKIQEYRLA
ncbi:sigma 54-interacting transcriptional regulator [Candidatus Poribacteria bacterium]|nr:sigma 54-interacting transcriptional regulator [Candidatus Poribacteria bacterium]